VVAGKDQDARYLLVQVEPRIAVGLATNFDEPNLGEVAFEIANAFTAASNRGGYRCPL
jgi:hypothetical protein